MAAESNRPIQVAPLTEERGAEVVALMGRAFQRDPLFMHACPDPDDRARWLPWLFRWSVWKGFLYGKTLGTIGRLDGVAAILGPGDRQFTEEDLERFAYGRGREVVGARVWDRATAAVNAAFSPADDALHRAVSEPHWYLDVVAVDPVFQGRGVGGALLRAAHARSDADEAPIVLLTFQPRNIGLYQRHGYVTVCEGMAPDGGPPWWGMRRDPVEGTRRGARLHIT
jgi:ribosomal protein S18 acetylase RimI-like enzyme